MAYVITPQFPEVAPYRVGVPKGMSGLGFLPFAAAVISGLAAQTYLTIHDLERFYPTAEREELEALLAQVEEERRKQAAAGGGTTTVPSPGPPLVTPAYVPPPSVPSTLPPAPIVMMEDNSTTSIPLVIGGLAAVAALAFFAYKYA